MPKAFKGAVLTAPSAGSSPCPTRHAASQGLKYGRRPGGPQACWLGFAGGKGEGRFVGSLKVAASLVVAGCGTRGRGDGGRRRAGSVPEGCARNRWPLAASAYRRPRLSRDSSERASGGSLPLALVIGATRGEDRLRGGVPAGLDTVDAMAASGTSPARRTPRFLNGESEL